MKHAIVTGANRGIGLSIVKEFARDGISVWACMRKKSEEFEKELQMMNASALAVEPLYFDITDREAAKSAAMSVYKKAGGIDILVNNAGVSEDSLFFMTSVKKMEEIFNVNFFSPLYFTQVVARLMARKSSGSIINIASVSGLQNEIGRIAYGSSKAALIFAGKTLSMEFGQYGIRVNTICPGFIDTDMWNQRREELREQILSETPLHRQGTPEEVAKAALFLANEGASYITGSNLVIDGGRTI
ncbi:MAG: SDR family oxidoreductase [Lachnospiraceae bacterium]|nr:SDR family oxidoreductase [Lachnospiraceae bacterium]